MRITETRREALSSLPDGELVDRCLAGEDLAWEVLVRRYRRLACAVPCRLGLSEHETEEVFHHTFVRLAEGVGRIKDRGRVRAWIVTTARRLSIDAIRRRRSSEVATGPEILNERPATSLLPPEVLEEAERQHLVRHALLTLGDRCRRLLTLLFYHSSEQPPSYEMVSRELGIPIGSIGPTRARCLERLLAEFKKLEDR
jgi:RNA polymerase sigma factor (sigma-70 family)